MGVLKKIPSMGEVWIFSGTTQSKIIQINNIDKNVMHGGCGLVAMKGKRFQPRSKFIF